MVYRVVQVSPEAIAVHPGGTPEQLGDESHVNHPLTAKRTQLTHRDRIASQDKGSALVERAHDATAVVAEFPLADHFTHAP